VFATYPKQDELDKMFSNTVRKMYDKGVIEMDDKVTYLSGHIGIGVADKTAGVSMLEVTTVSEILKN
ncbi:MAG: hypothetical protein IIZ88_02520, partial [Prevotella sp.]|nr:hypothetical protein [Prevotella sp.]